MVILAIDRTRAALLTTCGLVASYSNRARCGQQALQQATPREPAVFCRATQQSFLRLTSTPVILKVCGADGWTNRDELGQF
jgi:hypothetical protein